jgi:putative ABC transport system ATP-binding protein
MNSTANPNLHPRPAADLIRIVGVRKDYGTSSGVVHALHPLALTIREGEFVAIVGASGSGKSTLLNLLGCLDVPSGGLYELAGVEPARLAAAERALVRNRLIGFVFQSFNLLPRSTALENCELPLLNRGVPTRERRALATRALESMGLAHRLHHRPQQLSGGQQQRVAIARAIVTNPPLLLADEPTGNLDSRTSFEVLGLLQDLNRTRRITIVLVTHEPDVAACASRIVTMRDGRVIDDQPVLEPMDADRALKAMPPVANVLASSEGRPRAGDSGRPLQSAALGALCSAVGGGFLAASALLAMGRVPWVAPLAGSLLGGAWLAAQAPWRPRDQPRSDEDLTAMALGAAFATAVLALAALWSTNAPLVVGGYSLGDLRGSRAALPFLVAAIGVFGAWATNCLILRLLARTDGDDVV